MNERHLFVRGLTKKITLPDWRASTTLPSRRIIPATNPGPRTRTNCSDGCCGIGWRSDQQRRPGSSRRSSFRVRLFAGGGGGFSQTKCRLTSSVKVYCLAYVIGFSCSAIRAVCEWYMTALDESSTRSGKENAGSGQSSWARLTSHHSARQLHRSHA